MVCERLYVLAKEGFEAALLLLHNERADVQLFAACLLYDSIRKRWDEYVVSQDTASFFSIYSCTFRMVYLSLFFSFL